MKRRRRKNEEGQVIVEFLLVFSMIATLIFLFVQMSWGIAYGHYVHYATFMSSRAYLASNATKGDQTANAAAVLTQMVKSGGKDIFPFLAPSRVGGDRDASGPEPVKGAMIGSHPEFKPNSRLYSWAEGVQFNFNLRMFLLPISAFVAKGGAGQQIHPGGAGKVVSWKGVIPMTSDSFLGREPSVADCITDMTRLSTSTGIERKDGGVFIEDNGC